MTIVPPIVIDNRHPDEGIEVYDTADALAALEEWYLRDEDFVAYDSEGRLVDLILEERMAPAWLGLRQRRVHGVTAQPREDEPGHAAELRTALEGFLERQGVPSDRFGADAPLSDLIAEAARHAA